MAQTPVFCHEISKSFGAHEVVKSLSFKVEPGHILALLGPSGCGKTTTLRLIAGFERLDKGRIEIAGKLVADEHFHLPPEKRRIGMVFQDYAIFPHLNVGQNVSFGLGNSRQAAARTGQMLELVGLQGLEKMMPHELSGGQQQRVALARALALEPLVILLDEPFSNLDTSLRAQVRQEVHDLLKQARATALFVTHDQEEALFIGDKVAVMHQGKLEQIGSPEEIFHRPMTRFVAEFMGQTDFVPGIVTDQGVETPLGKLPQSLPLPEGATVSVAIRPDDVDLSANGQGSENGRIRARHFVGIANIYWIKLHNGVEVRSWQPHTVNLPLGAAVNAFINAEHPLTCFYGQKAYR